MAGGKKKRSTISQLGLAARASRTALSQELGHLDIYPGQDAVLLVVGEQDGLSLSDLAERLSVRPPTITKTIARLAAQGLLEKRPSPNDARQSHAFLTEKGQAVLDTIRASQKSVERAALSDFSDRERKLLRKLLQRVTRNLADGAPATPDERA